MVEAKAGGKSGIRVREVMWEVGVRVGPDCKAAGRGWWGKRKVISMMGYVEVSSF